MSWVNQTPVRTGTALDELPPGETMIASINSYAKMDNFNTDDLNAVMEAVAGWWPYTQARVAGRNVLVATAFDIVVGVFRVQDYDLPDELINGRRKGRFELELDHERTDAMRWKKSPYKRKRGQMGGIVFIGDGPGDASETAAHAGGAKKVTARDRRVLVRVLGPGLDNAGDVSAPAGLAPGDLLELDGKPWRVIRFVPTAADEPADLAAEVRPLVHEPDAT